MRALCRLTRCWAAAAKPHASRELSLTSLVETGEQSPPRRPNPAPRRPRCGRERQLEPLNPVTPPYICSRPPGARADVPGQFPGPTGPLADDWELLGPNPAFLAAAGWGLPTSASCRGLNRSARVCLRVFPDPPRCAAACCEACSRVRRALTLRTRAAADWGQPQPRHAPGTAPPSAATERITSRSPCAQVPPFTSAAESRLLSVPAAEHPQSGHCSGPPTCRAAPQSPPTHPCLLYTSDAADE